MSFYFMTTYDSMEVELSFHLNLDKRFYINHIVVTRAL